MELSKPTNTVVSAPNGAAAKTSRSDRRRKSEMTPANVRFFLPKAGSSAERPELGREITTENEVLVEAFRTGQPFFTLVAWKAIPEMGTHAPRIIKEAIKRN